MDKAGSNFERKSDRRGAESPKRGLLLLAVFLSWASAADSLFGRGMSSIVTNLDDGGPGSLREEIATAQAGGTISFALRGAIVLTNGELLISKNLRIVGPGATNLAVSARSQSRVMKILPGVAVDLSGLTICDGRAPDGAAGMSNSPAGGDGSGGGGIYNSGFLTMDQCIISNCAAGNGAQAMLRGHSALPTPQTGLAGLEAKVALSTTQASSRLLLAHWFKIRAGLEAVPAAQANMEPQEAPAEAAAPFTARARWHSQAVRSNATSLATAALVIV